MLTRLRIKNLALVSELEWELAGGLCTITGETGAGKSVIVGALNLLLGERADRSLVRTGADQCTVEATLEVSRLLRWLGPLLEESGAEPCEDGQLLLKRTFSVSGTNRQFVNGSPVTLAMLAAIGDGLVDMHGPHDHQSLLSPSKQLELLDAYGGAEEDREAFASLVRLHTATLEAKANLIVDEHTYRQQLDLLRFQIQEIEGAALSPEEEEKLDTEHRRATNAARLIELSQGALTSLADDEGSATQALGVVGRLLAEAQRLDPGAECLVSLHAQATEALRDLQTDLSHYADRIELDPARLAELEERVSLLQGLKRKYGGSVREILEFGAKTREELAALEHREEELARIDARLQELERQLRTAAEGLRRKRKAVLPGLGKAVGRELAELGFAQSEFAVTLEPTPFPTPGGTGWGHYGMDKAEFLFAPNPGEPPRLLRAIASSGEMSRVMLAIKTVLATQDSVPVLVFDEIDANVGGETAAVVGRKMRQIARQRQVLCITHLAPVAAAADAHWVVSKTISEGRTSTEIRRLGESERTQELTRMLGGQGEAARQHAAALLSEAQRGAQ